MHQRAPRQENSRSVLIIGGGVAGITAALDLAGSGHEVHLVEANMHLGGQVSKLDKIYPGDHCAFCPLWTDIKKCGEHPGVTVYTGSTVRDLKNDKEGYSALIVKRPFVIDEQLCVFCGKCVDACPDQAVHPGWKHASPPCYVIDMDACSRCDDCVRVCPTGAVDFTRSVEEITVIVDDIVWAAGFKEVDLSILPEFGVGSHPDIMTSMDFEEWSAEAGTNRGNILKKSNGSVPETIAFIQCAGARDQRLLLHCSAVCCMHAFKQAQWVKRRNREIECVIFYTDLRTVGKDYYEYSLREIEGSGITLVRGRPSLVYPLPGGDGIAVKYENTETRKREIEKFDMVVLNGNLQPSTARSAEGGSAIPTLDAEGFVDTTQDHMSRYACGFDVEPADIAESTVQASSVAMRIIVKSTT